MRIVYLVVAIIGIFLFLGGVGQLLNILDNKMTPESIPVIIIGIIGLIVGKISLDKFNNKSKTKNKTEKELNKDQ